MHSAHWNIKKKFPIKGGLVRQKHLGKMIYIDFYDQEGYYVCTHRIDFEDGCYYELGEVDDYVMRIFSFFESAERAEIFFCDTMKSIWRNE